MQDSEIRALVSLISDEDVEVQTHVQTQIMALGEPAIPYLESEWEHSLQPELQKRIEDIIHKLQFSQLSRRLEAWRDSDEQDLLEGMWLIATYQYPDLDLGKLRQLVEHICYEAWLELRPELHPLDQVSIINDVLFRRNRLAANTKNFHSPANSMLNIVLETRRGNPISLCVIYLLVCRKMKLPVHGVNLPNLFILTYKDEGVQFYINAFSKGITFNRKDIDNYLANLNLKPLPVFYEPCSNQDIIRRVLRNLIVSFEKVSEPDKAEEVRDLLRLVSGGEEIGE